ncbi:MAG: hypothetical protein GOV00_03795 [Candidatus Altiarchaeota archaeon]|nr:hypothetical protein [Candidatus Altiarchaeota archaeon]
MVTLTLLLTVFSTLFVVYAKMSATAFEKMEEFNHSIQVYHTRSLIESLRIFGGPFDYSGSLSDNQNRVVETLPFTRFNTFSGKYEYLACGRL